MNDDHATLRDRFAIAALSLFASDAVLIAVHDTAKAKGIDPDAMIAQGVYGIADAMMKRRNMPPENK